MTRSATALMLDADEPALRFEESASVPASPAYHNSPLSPASGENGDPYNSLKRKQEELLKIRQQLEKTERETNELESLRRKEDRFDSGRREMTEKLSRSLVRLERELYAAHKAIEEIGLAKEAYQRHLDVMRALQPEAWHRGNLEAELERAIGAIEDAEEEFGKTSRRLASVLPGEQAVLESKTSGSLPQDFVGWMRCGAAFTLPLIASTLLFWIVSRFFH